VRLLVSPLSRQDITPKLDEVMDRLDVTIPRGLGRGGIWHLSDEHALQAVLVEGAQATIRAGLGTDDDLARCEDGGVLAGADPSQVSERALSRGLGQMGSLGSGNHFLEIQVVDEVYDASTAAVFGVAPAQVCVMIHCGSRGLGHQICSDYVRVMLDTMPHHGIAVPDLQLACAPVESSEGRKYLAAMAAAANYGRANRQVLSSAVRGAFGASVGTAELRLLYDVSHNLAKLEHHEVNGERRLLCVHRKGATRALPPGHPALPEDLRAAGQPVLVPGSMGTASYILVGVTGGGAFHSTCHGAGRTMSRHAATRKIRGRELREQLAAADIRPCAVGSGIGRGGSVRIQGRG
jgi:tRNA-splicing ligase RtcB (3'-phosphate/5'-hydroxy nucleic acid ligase)